MTGTGKNEITKYEGFYATVRYAYLASLGYELFLKKIHPAKDG
jgi:hypothetical protein